MNNSRLGAINKRLEKALQINKKRKGIETAGQSKDLEDIWCSWIRRHRPKKERLEKGPEAPIQRSCIRCSQTRVADTHWWLPCAQHCAKCVTYTTACNLCDASTCVREKNEALKHYVIDAKAVCPAGY